MTNPAIDRLERAQRLTAGIPRIWWRINIEYSYRSGGAVLSAVLFHIQEAQRIMARSLQEENKIAIDMAGLA